VDGSALARAFFTFAALVGAAMCSASHEGACVKLLHFDTPPISALRRG
jgi:hypothetical protein